MKMFALSDDKNTLTGLRLAGIEGELKLEKKELEEAITKVRANHDVAVLLMTEGCAQMAKETVQELKLSSENPLLVIVPSSQGSNREKDSITRLIREAIGIKV